MIARIWRGAVRAQDAAAYAAYVQRTGIEGYQGTPGNRGAWLLQRIEGDRAEFITVSFWDSREAIEAFAGQDINTAVFYPDDDQFLIERDLTVNHYQVAGSDEAAVSRAKPAKPVPGAPKTHLSRQNRDFLRCPRQGLTARLNSDRRTDSRN